MEFLRRCDLSHQAAEVPRTGFTLRVTASVFAHQVCPLLNTKTRYDQIKVTGTVDLTGSTLDATLYGGFVPKVGQSYTIIDNDAADAVTGTFTGIANGGTYSNQGVTYTVNYDGGDGNDVVLTVKAVDAAAVPAKPDTGFALVSAHPMLALATSTLAAAAILVAARKLRPSVK